MGAPPKIPSCGDVEIIVGPMGSGKTLYITDLVTTLVQTELRPIFTNTPFRWPVFRKYLAGKFGPEAANLVFPLTQEHLDRFIERQHKVLNVREEYRAACKKAGEPFRESRADELVVDALGEHTHVGDDANWILPGSYVIIDEAQRWFPMQKQGAERSTNLQNWLTMCRHHWQQVIFVTQDATTLDVVARKLCRLYHIARKRDEDRILWALRFKDLGLKVVGFAKYTKEQIESKIDLAGEAPLSQKTIFLNAPWSRWRFRLYSSFTHVGSPRRMNRALNETREQLGVGDLSRRRAVAAEQERKQRPMKLSRLFRRLAWGVLKTSVVAVVAFGVGTAMNKPADTQDPEQPVTAQGNRVFTPPAELVAVSRTGVVVGDRVLREGDFLGPAELVWFDRRNRVCMFALDDRVYLWSLRRPPKDVGPVDRVLATIRRVSGSPGPGVEPGGGGQG